MEQAEGRQSAGEAGSGGISPGRERARTVAILGAGVSGLVLAGQVREQGCRVVVIDDYAHAGGNHISRIIDGMEFDVGAIYFHAADYQFKFMPSLREACVVKPIRLFKLNRAGRLTRFPFDGPRDIGRAGMVRGASSLLAARLLGRDPYRHADLESFLQAQMGRYLYEASGLRNYLRRLYGCDPTEIDSAFGAKRLGWIARNVDLRARARKLVGTAMGRPPPRPVSMTRPPGGFPAYYRIAQEALEARGVRFVLDAGLRAIERAGEGFLVSSAKGVFRADELVSTMPMGVTARLAGLAVPDLPHVRLLSLFVSADRPLGFDGEILYNFSPEAAWKRLTLHSAMYGAAVHGIGSGRCHFTVEVTVPEGAPVPSAKDAFADFARHFEKSTGYGGALALVGHHVLGSAYPVYRLGFGAARDAALDALEAYGIRTVGRQGRFEYLPSSSVASKLAEAAASDLNARR